jgi:NADH-quinone oxidoreductase subunit M
MFGITSLSVTGLPMLNGFVGEFLVLSGSMQSVFAHHIGWTVLGTTGVIFTASYMLWMIQRVFYGELGHLPAEHPTWDLDGREHITLWPIMVLMLVMGVASPYWMRAIDTAGRRMAMQLPPGEQPSAKAEAAISIQEGGQR